MTAPDPAALTALAALAIETRGRLTAPGGPFELRDEDVRGLRLPVFAHRRRSLREWLAESAGFGDREYLVQGDRRIEFDSHLADAAALADLLATDHGVRPGDRVAIFAANSPEWVTAFWATTSLGAVVVAANAWWTAPEAEYSLRRLAPSVIIADDRRAAVLEGIAGLDVAVLRVDDVPQRVAARRGVPLPDAAINEDDPAIVMFTSGTTGYPKGVTHSHRNLLAVIEGHRLGDAVLTELAAATGTSPPPDVRRFLVTMPLFHIACLHNLVVPRLATGDTVVLDAGAFDVDRVLRLIERERVTNWAVVPTMAHRVVTHGSLDRYDLGSLTAMSINSAPSSPALKEHVRAAVPTVTASLADSYGLTETSTAATVATAVDLALFPTSVGRPVVSMQVQIRDAFGEPVADGEEGEIWLRSQFTMLGYWDDPQATAAAITPDGWLRTGDVGSLRDGRLFMASRRSDLILRGGENVYPAEIEAVLDEHPAVAECAVFGVDDADLGQAVAVRVVLARDAAEAELRAAEADLRAYAAQRLAYFKVPAHWQLVRDPLPRNATGKVIRSRLALSDPGLHP